MNLAPLPPQGRCLTHSPSRATRDEVANPSVRPLSCQRIWDSRIDAGCQSWQRRHRPRMGWLEAVEPARPARLCRRRARVSRTRRRHVRPDAQAHSASWGRSNGAPKKPFNANKTAAASLLPPPNPLPIGMRFTRSMLELARSDDRPARAGLRRAAPVESSSALGGSTETGRPSLRFVRRASEAPIPGNESSVMRADRHDQGRRAHVVSAIVRWRPERRCCEGQVVSLAGPRGSYPQPSRGKHHCPAINTAR